MWWPTLWRLENVQCDHLPLWWRGEKRHAISLKSSIRKGREQAQYLLKAAKRREGMGRRLARKAAS